MTFCKISFTVIGTGFVFDYADVWGFLQREAAERHQKQLWEMKVVMRACALLMAYARLQSTNMHISTHHLNTLYV